MSKRSRTRLRRKGQSRTANPPVHLTPRGRRRGIPSPTTTVFSSFHVIVFTYNRPDHLRRLLRDIIASKGRHTVRVHVYDDASTEDYADVVATLKHYGWSYHQASANHGKRGFWKWVTTAYGHVKKSTPADYYVVLPDDVRLCRDFFSAARDRWNSIPDASKGAMTLLRDSGRDGKPCWTGQKPIPHPGLFDTGWVDGAFIAQRRYFELLGYGVPPVPDSWWDNNPKRGSGAGQVVSSALYKQGVSLWQSKQSLVAHMGHASEMNPVERIENPLKTLAFIDGDHLRSFDERVEVSFAAVPWRKQYLSDVVQSLIHQCDVLRVHLNGFLSVPPELQRSRIQVTLDRKGRKGDAGKFHWCHQTEGYQFTCDDDIIYPLDYVDTLIRGIERYGRKAVVGVHGAVINTKPEVYYRDRKVFHCLRGLPTDVPVHLVGTGTTGYHSSTIKLNPGHFELPNMADIWLAVQGRKQRVPFVCLAHDADWLKAFPDPEGQSIYARYSGRAYQQDNVIRRFSPWPPVLRPQEKT